MPFDTLSPPLQVVAKKALAHCKDRYGANGLKMDEGIDASISWRPTFFLKPQKLRIIAVEVEDNLYPQSLKIAAHDLGHFDFPTSVYQVCSLAAYQTDPKHAKVNLLRKHGFGIITVDDDGNVVFQVPCIPLLQHISSDQFESEISGLNSTIKVPIKAAYETYQGNEGQGLQMAGQVVEALVGSIAKRAEKEGVIPNAGKALADVIDDLYGAPKFKPHRAALGAARGFVKEFRNTASHAPRTPKAAAEKLRKCKAGFLEAIGVCHKLRAVAQAVGYKTTVYIA